MASLRGPKVAEERSGPPVFRFTSLQACRGLSGPRRTLGLSPLLRAFVFDFDVVNHLVVRLQLLAYGAISTLQENANLPAACTASLCTLRPCCFALHRRT